MNIDAAFNVSFKALDSSPQLVIIPVNDAYGVIAVVKPLGGGKAACIAFAPATSLANPLTNFRPSFLRKLVTTDLPLREGRWQTLGVQNASSHSLRSAVNVLIKDFDKLDASQIQEIDLCRPSNSSSAPDIAGITYRAPEAVSFERALGHLVCLEHTVAYAQTRAALPIQDELLENQLVVSVMPSVPQKSEEIASLEADENCETDAACVSTSSTPMEDALFSAEAYCSVTWGKRA